MNSHNVDDVSLDCDAPYLRDICLRALQAPLQQHVMHGFLKHTVVLAWHRYAGK